MSAQIINLHEDYLDLDGNDYWQAVRRMNHAELVMELRKVKARSDGLLAECLAELSHLQKVIDGEYRTV
jgi:hypothetical protein